MFSDTNPEEKPEELLPYGYRLGIDMGANSIGWAILSLDQGGEPIDLVRAGSRIFREPGNARGTDPHRQKRKNYTQARSQRRNRDRTLKRMKRLEKLLIEAELMPRDDEERKDMAKLDPYELRARALDDENLTRHELGRAIWHIAKRRGFLSNRKEDSAETADETSKMKVAIENFKTNLAETDNRTIGEFLHERLKEGKPTRFTEDRWKPSDVEELPLTRELIKEEFWQIVEAQRDLGGSEILEDSAWKKILEFVLGEKDTDLKKTLGSCELLPAKKSEQNKTSYANRYELRKRALKEPLESFQLGETLLKLHNNKRFKPKAGEDQHTAVQEEIQRIRCLLEESNSRTAGEYQYDRSLEAIYPARFMTEQELKKIREKQRGLVDDAIWDKIEDTILFQRPLKPVNPGLCQFEEGELRAPTALPSVQRFRILQELANLRLIIPGEFKRQLNKDERDKIYQKLIKPRDDDLSKAGVFTFDAMRKALKLPRGMEFNLQDDKRKGLKPDETARKMAHSELFGDRWFQMELKDQDAVIEDLLKGVDFVEDGAESNRGGPNAFERWKNQNKENEALKQKARNDWGLSEDNAGNLIETSLPSGYGSLSRKAIGKILRYMKEEVIHYSEAAEKAGYNHSETAADGSCCKLPYYGRILTKYVSGSETVNEPSESPNPNPTGCTCQACASGSDLAYDITRYGKITNPTVHIALNQLRRVVNALIECYGKPTEVFIEMARELAHSQNQKDKIEKQQTAERKANVNRDKIIKEAGLIPSQRYRGKLRLWEEQGRPQERICPFCGEIISCSAALDDRTEIEHLLPYSKTLDDSWPNKVLTHRDCNRRKGARTPFEVFGPDPLKKWTKNLPDNKRWRFKEDAMDEFKKDDSYFVERQLNDTRYMSKAARQYITSILPENKIVVSNGRLTSLLRASWGMNSILGQDRTPVREYECLPLPLPDFRRIEEGAKSVDGKWKIHASLLSEKIIEEMGINENDYVYCTRNPDPERSVTFDIPAKNRSDHRHHAIDAAVIAATSRSMIQRISSALQDEPDPDQVRRKRARNWPKDPWKNFNHEDFRHKVMDILVSHKPDRPAPGKPKNLPKGRDVTSGKLHEETAYGITGKKERGYHVLTSKKSLVSFKNPPEKDLWDLEDQELREALMKLWQTVKEDGSIEKKDRVRVFSQRSAAPRALEQFGFKRAPHGVKKARTKVPMKEYIAVKDRTGRVFKAYKPGGNAFMDVYQMPDRKWKALTISKYDANRKNFVGWYQEEKSRMTHPNAKKVMRLYNGDCLRLQVNGDFVIYRLQKMSGQILVFAQLYEADADKRDRDKEDDYKFLRKTANSLRENSTQRVAIDELGREKVLPLPL